MQNKNTLNDIFRDEHIRNEYVDAENMKKEKSKTVDIQTENTGDNNENIIVISLENTMTKEQFTLDVPRDVRIDELCPAMAEKLGVTDGYDFVLRNATKNFDYRPDDTFNTTDSENYDYCILNYSIDTKTGDSNAAKDTQSHEAKKNEKNKMKSFTFEGMTFFVYKGHGPDVKNERNEESAILISQYSILLKENEKLKEQIAKNKVTDRNLLETKEQLDVTKKELLKAEEKLNQTRKEKYNWRKNEKISKILSISSFIMVLVGIAIVIPARTQTIGTMVLVLGIVLAPVSVFFNEIQKLIGGRHG